VQKSGEKKSKEAYAKSYEQNQKQALRIREYNQKMGERSQKAEVNSKEYTTKAGVMREKHSKEFAYKQQAAAEQAAKQRFHSERAIKLQEGLICPPGSVRKQVRAQYHVLNACGQWVAKQTVNQQLENSLRDTVRFKPNKIDLTAAGKGVLQRVALILKKYPEDDIAIVGETPVAGPAGQHLAGGRAMTTLKYLQQLGVKNTIVAKAMTSAPLIGLKIFATGGDLSSKPPGCTNQGKYSMHSQFVYRCVSPQEQAQKVQASKEQQMKLQYSQGALTRSFTYKK